MNTKIIFAILFMFLSCGTIFAQTDENALLQKADSLISIGKEFFNEGKYDDAYGYYAQATEMTININEGYNNSVEMALYNIGRIYVTIGDYQQALENYIAASEIHRIIAGENNQIYARMLFAIGIVYYSLGDYQNALENFTQVSKIRKKILDNNDPEYINSLKHIAVTYNTMGDYPNALKYFKETADLTKKVFGEENVDYANYMNDIGVIYKTLGDYEKCLDYYTKALKIRERVLGVGSMDYTLSLNNIGILLSELGYYENALEYLNLVLEIRKETLGENHPYYASALVSIGQVYVQMDDGKNALRYYTMAFETGGVNLDDATRAQWLNDIGLISYNLGDYENAEKSYLLALDIWENVLGVKDSNYAQLMNNIGLLLADWGDYQNAMVYYLEAMDVWGETIGEDHPNYAALLSNIGILYYYVGDYPNALKYYTQALEIRKKVLGENDPDYAMTLNNIGMVYHDMGDYANAQKYYKQAMEIIGPEHLFYAQPLNNMSLLYLDQEDYQKALEYQMQAMEYFKKSYGAESPHYASALNNIGFTYTQIGDYENAMKYLTQALEIRRIVLGEEHTDYAATLLAIGMAYYSVDKNAEAMMANKQATDIRRNNLIRNFSYMTAYEREAYWNAYKEGFALNILYMYDVYEDTLATKTAYDTELITKGLLLASEISITDIIMESNNENLISEYETLKDMHLQLNKELEKPIAERVLNCDSLENEVQKMERNIMENCKEFGDVTHFIRIDWKEVQKSLNPNDVAIEFANYTFEDSTKYVALVLTKDMEAPVCVPLFNDKKLKKMIRGVAPAKTETPDNDENRGATSVSAKKLGIYESTELYRTLWKPLEKYFPENPRIYFAPSGTLHQIAIEYAPVGEGKLISDKYEIYRVSSTRFLAMDYMTKPMTNSVLYGGVYYDSDTTTMKQESERYSTRSATYNSFAEFNKGEDRGSLNYLQGTKTEVEDIVGKLKANNISTTLYEGSQASEESFKALSGSKISALHIATHGFFLPSDEILSGDQSLIQSGLLLSGANYAWQNLPIPDGVEDGILTAKEISFIDLRNTDLVVLSACQTALGEITGEGVFGLQRGFKKAGARTIIMSLWPVDDNATLLMMTEFYTNLTNGMTKREAFNAAQNKVKTTAGFENPRYWAAFIMLDGNEK